MTRLPLCGIFLVCLSAGFAAEPTATAAAAPAPLEVVGGVQADADGLALIVATTGYTEKASFRLVIDEKADAAGVRSLTVQRLQRDAGKAMPSALKLTWTWKELGVEKPAPLRLANPVMHIGL